jgi:hypothetical protein
MFSVVVAHGDVEIAEPKEDEKVGEEVVSQQGRNWAEASSRAKRFQKLHHLSPGAWSRWTGLQRPSLPNGRAHSLWDEKD